MNSNDLDQLIQKFLAGNCTYEEKQFLVRWYANLPSEEAGDMDQVGKLIWAELKENALGNEEKRHHISHFSATVKIAASIVVLIGLTATGYFIGSNKNKIQRVFDSNRLISRINTSEKTEIVSLEDGSRISLQPNSELNYPEHFTDGLREVSITGEAFFEIAHDKTHPFVVHARDVITKVLGTSFTIRAYADEDVLVQVKTGKVSVTTLKGSIDTLVSNNEVFLTPNQQIVYDKAAEELVVSLAERPEIVEEVPLLNKKFSKAYVAEIFEALETAYKIDIQFNADDMAGCRVTTDFMSGDDDLYDHIRFICHAIGVKYTVHNTSIVIEGQGCK